MTPNEIKQNMTQGKWRGKDTTYTKEEPFTVTPEDGGTPWIACERAIFVGDVRLGALCMYTVSSSTKYPTTVEEISADHAAIVSAVNGTYGVGIDPSKVKEMYDMLMFLCPTLLRKEPISLEDFDKLTELLNSAKL